MHILIYRWRNDFYSDVEECFRKMGYTIEHVEHEFTDVYDDNRFQTKLESLLTRTQYDFVFSIDYFPVISEACRICEINYICWTINSPLPQMYHKSIFNDINYIFTYDKLSYVIFKKMAVMHIYYLPIGAALDRIEEVTKKCNPSEYESNISIIGNLYSDNAFDNLVDELPPYLTGYFDCAIEAQLQAGERDILSTCINDSIVNLMKPYFQVSRPVGSLIDISNLFTVKLLGKKIACVDRHRGLNQLAKYFNVNLYSNEKLEPMKHVTVRKKPDYYSDYPKIFHNSKININFAQPKVISGVPLRVWNTLASGGFLITHSQSELTDFFEVGRDLVTFEGPTELKEKVWYYMNHESERQKIAENGRKRVGELGNLSSRIDNIIKTFRTGEQPPFLPGNSN